MHNSQKKFIIPVVVVLIVMTLTIGYHTYAISMPKSSIQAEGNGSASSQPCAAMYPNGGRAGTLLALNSSSPAELCVKYYYYNTTSAFELSPLGQLTITGLFPIPNTNISRLLIANSSEFSIQAAYDGTQNSYSNVSVGGQSSSNEGTLVVYKISTTTSTPTGTYFISLGALIYPEGSACATDLELLVGNVSLPPNVVGGAGPCLGQPGGPTNSEGFRYASLYAEIVGTTNSASS